MGVWEGAEGEGEGESQADSTLRVESNTGCGIMTRNETMKPRVMKL